MTATSQVSITEGWRLRADAGSCSVLEQPDKMALGLRPPLRSLRPREDVTERKSTHEPAAAGPCAHDLRTTHGPSSLSELGPGLWPWTLRKTAWTDFADGPRSPLISLHSPVAAAEGEITSSPQNARPPPKCTS